MLRWQDDHVVVGGTTLLTLGEQESVDAATIGRISVLRSTSERLVILKTRRLLEYYVGVLEALRPERVLELGIYQGGSVALVAETVAPKTLVALDIAPEPVAALDEWIETWSGPTRIKTCYGLDQTDTPALDRIVEDDFGGTLDLVIDDASHWVAETRRSFNALFPRLRPGGIYLVEDWSWAHRVDSAFLTEHTPLTVFLCEVIVACAHVPGLIERVDVGPDAFAVRRGPAPLEPGTFDVSSYVDPRARAIVPDLQTTG